MIKILIVKTSSLGDILHCFPFLEHLKEALPDAEIDWVVEEECQSLVAAHSQVKRIFAIPFRKMKKSFLSWTLWKEIFRSYRAVKKENYDLVFDLQGNIKSASIVAVCKGKRKIGFGLSYVAEWPNVLVTTERYTPPKGLNIRDDYLFLLKQVYQIKNTIASSSLLKLTKEEKRDLVCLLQNLQENKILICPGAAWKNKQLGDQAWSRLIELVRQKTETSFLLAWGSEKERKLCIKLAASLGPQAIVLPSRLSFPLLQNLMTHMNLVIAMDSLPLHLAATACCPTWSFFGPSNGEKYAPQGSQHVVNQGRCPYGIRFDKRCPKLRTCPTGACMKQEALNTNIVEAIAKFHLGPNLPF